MLLYVLTFLKHVLYVSFIDVLQKRQAVTVSNGFEVWIETVTSAVQTANNNGKVPVTGVDHPASPNVHTFCWKVVCFVVGCVWEFAMGHIYSCFCCVLGAFGGPLLFEQIPASENVCFKTLAVPRSSCQLLNKNH